MTRIEWRALTADSAAEIYKWSRHEKHLEAIDPSLLIRMQSPRRCTFVGHSDGAVIAELDCQIEGSTVWFSIAVTPGWRRRGIATLALHHLRQWAVTRGIDKASASVEPENSASLHLLRYFGFKLTEAPDADGLLTAELDLTA